MKRIPTLEEAERMHDVLTKAGHGIYALTKLERIIYEYTPKHLLKALQFRFQLKKVLDEGAKRPRTYKRFGAFAKRYFTGPAKGNEFALEILSGAVTEWNQQTQGGTTALY